LQLAQAAANIVMFYLSMLTKTTCGMHVFWRPSMLDSGRDIKYMFTLESKQMPQGNLGQPPRA
jgi:hypothetical protein